MTRKSVFRERKRSYTERPIENIPTKERFLIVCEGAKTEPNYFRSFRVPKDVIDVRGIGANTVDVVEKAIELKSKDDYDQIWCVFDRDSFPATRFNEAFVLASRNNIKIAYSNEAFELWYLLHFNYYDTGMSRKQYGAKLTDCLGYKYEKNSTTIYEEILEMQPQAIKNAEKLIATYNPKNPERDNPSTKVHCLVEELNKFIS
jgi:RloB-like protein